MLLTLATFLLRASALPQDPGPRVNQAESSALRAGPMAGKEAEPIPTTTEPRAASETRFRDRDALLVNASIMPHGELALLLSDQPATPDAAQPDTVANLPTSGRVARLVALPSA